MSSRTGIANRTRAETEKLIGFFVNTIIIRANFADGPSFRELLKQVREATKFDLIMWVEESNNRMTVSIQYATDLFTASTIDQLLDYYEVLLRGVVAAPDQEVASLPLQDSADFQDLQDIYQLS